MVIAKPGLDKDFVIDELATSLDLAFYVVKHPEHFDEIVIDIINEALDLCKEQE